MKLSINLASKPFFELRPLFYRLRIAMVSLAVLALILAIALHVVGKQADGETSVMQDLSRQTDFLIAERTANENSMRQPMNAAVLEQSQFLNGLFAQKAFSWTAVMMDLENILPMGVQVTSIDPAIDKDGSVIIRLRVSGERDKAVDLVRNLETSKHFRQPRLADEATQSQETNGGANRVSTQSAGLNGVEFDIFAGYNPLPLHDVHSEKSDAGNDVSLKGGE